MKKIPTILLFLILSVFLMAGNAFALSLGTDITIWDNKGVLDEDGEVEPGCVWDQAWDLEGFFLEDTTLTMVGGYDFEGGYGGYAPGDIFIDVDGDALYGKEVENSGSVQHGEDVVGNTFGYDYVIDMSAGEVYSINSATLLTVYYSQNDTSNPWLFSTGETSNLNFNPNITYLQNDEQSYELSDSDVGGLEGGIHYAVAVDLGFLKQEEIANLLVHYTYECGNDNLMGKVPEPSTMLLLGFGLVGLAAVGRKRIH